MSDRLDVSIETVARLIAEQFPQWADLQVRPVSHSGWDNRSFRLGERMLIRLPSAEGYVPQVEKEHRWLPYLAKRLPLPIPEPLAKGRPSEDYPFPWSIYRWLDGEPLALKLPETDLKMLAEDVAAFLRALHAIDASDGPLAGAHNFHRGGSLRVYDAQARDAIEAVSDEVDADLARAIWEVALKSGWQGRPVWVHGDIAEGNLLMQGGRLSAVIDFGSSGVGDPASDLILAWNVLDADSRAVFRQALPLDAETWQRGRGWALWKAMIVLAAERGRDEKLSEWSRRTIREVMADHLKGRKS
ncbi:aminoglycoside phosphotransferase (APT) family kinase protein [Agrobacterium larrymoorei]|uniref:Aminoglycoside phosphotransferase (APT) family kinase protein n=1 Tax=Agrobacterium larrymoorei TaxID=160699 RepID=A0AAJ2B970_9HYPH|nr:aminoglycoside phosphotransferase family protein [Agrobacterium larrymoorei]MDR6102673.1 aminoglycoside phosphotransferase (APT) family kinase protein [Agrobacterium larrymoorei]